MRHGATAPPRMGLSWKRCAYRDGMHNLGRGAALLAAVMLAATAAGCAGGGAVTGGGGSVSGGGESPAPPTPADCLMEGSPWQLDTADLQLQLLMVTQDQGIPVTNAVVTGTMTIEIGPGLTVVATDATQTEIDADLSGGLTMQMFQKHTGTSGGTWRISGETLESASPWSGGITVDTNVLINGQAGGTSTIPPGPTDWSVPTEFDCALDELYLMPEGSPYSLLFH